MYGWTVASLPRTVKDSAGARLERATEPAPSGLGRNRTPLDSVRRRRENSRRRTVRQQCHSVLANEFRRWFARALPFESRWGVDQRNVGWHLGVAGHWGIMMGPSMRRRAVLAVVIAS